MPKHLMMGAWACIVSIVSMMLALTQMTPQETSEASAPAFSLDYVKTPIISVPVLRQGKIDGYAIVQFVYIIDRSSLGSSSAPVDALMTDELYRAILNNPQIDITRSSTINTAAFTKGLTSNLNTRLGSNAVQEILVVQFNYLTKTEIREQSAKRQKMAAKATSKGDDGHGDATRGEAPSDAPKAYVGDETGNQGQDEQVASDH